MEGLLGYSGAVSDKVRAQLRIARRGEQAVGATGPKSFRSITLHVSTLQDIIPSFVSGSSTKGL